MINLPKVDNLDVKRKRVLVRLNMAREGIKEYNERKTTTLKKNQKLLDLTS